MALIDISRPISPTTAVWPGDEDVEWSWTTKLGRDDASVNLGSIKLSTHVGSHVDAPLHVDEDGGAIDNLPLSAFVGRADLVDVRSESSIRPEHLREVTANRVLFKTDASHLSDDEWPDSITAVDPATIRQLGEEGGVLVGTDAPSVDPLDSTSLPAHHALIEAGIVNVESLCFEGVAPGSYLLMAFPLKIPGADASPVRAVLREDTPE